MATFKRFSTFIFKAYNGLKSLTDPAQEGSPYMESSVHPVPFSRKNLFFFSKRVMVRV